MWDTDLATQSDVKRIMFKLHPRRTPGNMSELFLQSKTIGKNVKILTFTPDHGSWPDWYSVLLRFTLSKIALEQFITDNYLLNFHSKQDGIFNVESPMEIGAYARK